MLTFGQKGQLGRPWLRRARLLTTRYTYYAFFFFLAVCAYILLRRLRVLKLGRLIATQSLRLPFCSFLQSLLLHFAYVRGCFPI